MLIAKGNTDIEIIQGDTFFHTIRLKNVDLDTIESIYLSCDKLGITEQYTRNDDVFELEIDRDKTCNFDNGVFCYDLTVNFIENKTKTIIYKGKLTVLEKENKVTL